MTRATAGVALWALLFVPLATAETPPEPATRTAVAGDRYRARMLRRRMLGDGYRDLWTLPVTVPVLDLRTEAGGLTPVRRVGGQQTKGLALRGADGRDYTFRGVDKDPSEVLPPDLRGTIADEIVQDQISAGHPVAGVVTSPILDVVGVLHPRPRLVILPDDPALGEFRQAFAGLMGSIEEYPRPASESQPGFEGATEILTGDEMWKRVDASPADRIDAHAFLRARLLDLLFGDWDRHRKQWRWARIPGERDWQPIAEDRDQAFARFSGALLRVARNVEPRLLEFGPRYAKPEGATFNGWEQDRWILPAVPASTFDAAAREIAALVTDDVIDRAVRRLPPEYFAKDGERLAATLKVRRDTLPAAARAFYRHLAREVVVRCTDAAEEVLVEREANGDVRVRVGVRDQPLPPYFEARFPPANTSEVRVDLRGGDDRAVVRGSRGPITLRVLGGPGNDTLEDPAGGTRFSDAEGEDAVQRGPGTQVDRRPYVPPPPNPKAPWIPPRDWGGRSGPILWMHASPDLGLFVGGGFRDKDFGFRKDPFASHHLLRAGYATAARTARIDYEGEAFLENSRASVTVLARASGIEILRYYGPGNEAPSTEADSFYKVEQQQVIAQPTVTLRPSGRLSLSAGPAVKYARTELDEKTFISQAPPYGSEHFGQLGAVGLVQYDHRDRPVAPERGYAVNLGGSVYPALWDVKTAFGELHGDATGFVTASRLTLGLRAGAKRVFGTYPFHEAAFLGGAANLRGLPAQRYAGDAAVWGSAEARLFLGRVFLVLPGEIGLFALADTGRVLLEGESSDRWHTAVGGGVWLAYLKRTNTVSFALARAEGRTGLYVRAGFGF